MNEFFKNTWSFWALTIFAVGLTILIIVPASADQSTEIQKNLELKDATTVDDQVGKVIRVHIHDGMTSSDKIQ